MLTLQTLGFELKPRFPEQDREGEQKTKTSALIPLFNSQMKNELGKTACLAVFCHDNPSAFIA